MNEMDILLRKLGTYSKTRGDDSIPKHRLTALISAFHETETAVEDVDGGEEMAQSAAGFFDSFDTVVTHLFDARLGGAQASHRGATQVQRVARALPIFKQGVPVTLEINPKAGMAPFTPEAVLYLREPGSPTYRAIQATRSPQPGPLPGWVTYQIPTADLSPGPDAYDIALLLLPQKMSPDQEKEQPQALLPEALSSQGETLARLSFGIN